MGSERLKKEISKMPPSEREKLRKEMEESLREMRGSKQDLEFRKIPNTSVGSVTLTFWDKFLVFIFSIFNIMSLEEYIRRKRLRMIKDRVSHLNPPIMNVTRKVIYAQFGRYLYELYTILDGVIEILSMTVFNPNVWDTVSAGDTKLCSEYLFEFLTNTKPPIGISDIKAIISEYKSLRKILDRIEVEVEDSISALDPPLLNRANKIYTRLFVFKDLGEQVSFKKMLRYFLDDKGRISGNAVPDLWFTEELEKLCNIISEIDITPMMIDVIIALKRYLEELVDKQSEDYKKLTQLSQILTQENLSKGYEIVEKMNLPDVVSILKEDPDYIPVFLVPEQSLANVYKEVVTRKSKNLASRIVKSIVDEKKKAFYRMLGRAENETNLVETIYLEENNDKLLLYKLGTFSHPTAFQVIYSFFRYFWKPLFRETLNDLVVNGIFKEKYLKTIFSSIISSIDETEKQITNFIKLTAEGGEHYNAINRFLENPNSARVESSRRAIQQRIYAVNSLAESITLKYYDVLSQLNKHLKFVINDHSSLSPEYVLNIRTIKGIHNRTFMENLEKGYKVIELLLDILSHYTN